MPTATRPRMPRRAIRPRVRPAALMIAALLTLGLSACGSGASASTGSPPDPPNCSATGPKLTVDASGTASATPDTLTISMGVQVDDSAASAALSDANRQATTLTGSLQAAGVAPADVRSTDFSIVPTFTPTGRISGYAVSNMILVTLHDLANAGRVVDTAASSVGDAIRVEGITFSVSDTGNVDGQARAAAVSAAAAHARSMAKAAGQSLGGICSVSDTTTTSPVPRSAAVDAAGAVAAAPVPLEPGTQQASAEVTVVYALGPR